MTDLNNAINNLITHLTNVRAESNKNYRHTTPEDDIVEADGGRKFLRLVYKSGAGRSVWGFVALTNGNTKTMGEYFEGDVFMSATWKAPAKGRRGNVFDPNSWGGFGPYGPQYLR
jgi:hypothetical protein